MFYASSTLINHINGHTHNTKYTKHSFFHTLKPYKLLIKSPQTPSVCTQCTVDTEENINSDKMLNLPSMILVFKIGNISF